VSISATKAGFDILTGLISTAKILNAATPRIAINTFKVIDQNNEVDAPRDLKLP